MPTSQQDDTEITLGTGKILGLFFGLTALCAVFFGLGFTFGKNSAHPSDAAPASVASISQPSTPKPSASLKPVEAPDPVGTQADSSDKSVLAPAKPDAATGSTGNEYYLQVAAVSKQEDADALIEALKKKQYSVFLPPPSGA